jgi:hypothetical protein
MAITTLDQAIAGMQPTRIFSKTASPNATAGRMQSSWGTNGIPGFGNTPSTLVGSNLSSTGGAVQGQLPFTDAPSGLNYLARFVADMSVSGKVLLCDRLWHNGGITAVTTLQTVGSPTFPARDINGQNSGVGVMLGAEYVTTGAASAPTISVSYLNTNGIARSGNNIYPVTASSTVGAFYQIAFLAGDVGAQQVTSVQFSSAPTAGSVALVAYRVLAALEIAGPYQAAALDLVTGGMSVAYNGTVPFIIFIPSAAGAIYISGATTYTQG